MLLDAEGDGEDDVAFLPGKWPLKFDKWNGGAAGTKYVTFLPGWNHKKSTL